LQTHFYKHVPGILTGVGIIGTFTGLITGLMNFDVSSPEQVQMALSQLVQTVGQAFWISAVAITLAMIAETIENPTKHKFVLIAPATKTTTTFERYFNMMHLSPAIRAAFNELVEKGSGLPITYFEADRAIEKYDGDLLWVHDRDDLVCPFEDLVEFQKKAPKNIKFLITNGLGHNKVYKTPEIIDKIMAFLAPIE
jgi:pimeloyl-ACP methyl ester carboxylesterase